MTKQSLCYLTLLIMGLAYFNTGAWAQQSKVTLNGFVSDITTGETLIGAQVAAVDQKVGTVTNNYGHYALQLPHGEVRITFSYIGYQRIDTLLHLSKDLNLNIRLQPVGRELNEVVITGSRTSEYHGLETGRTKLSMSELERTPMFFGEPDIVKYAQLQPGVARGQEGFTGMVVRGGNADENLYLIDGNPMYNINHLFGLFSTFNSDAVKTANLYKGSFPARFGGRLSSVLDVRMRDGDLEKYSGTISIGLISSRFNIEGPISKGRTSFSLSGRRTYLDVVAKPFIAYGNKVENSSNDKLYTKSNFGYYFYDLTGKITHRFSDKDRLSLTLYGGDDVLYANMQEYLRSDKNSSQKEFEAGFNGTDIKWGSRLAALGWNHLFSPTLFANTTLYYGKYRSKIGLHSKSYNNMVFSHNEEPKYYTDMKFGLSSGIEDYGLRSDFDYRPTNSHFVRFGGNAIHHTFRPNVEQRSISSNAPLGPEMEKFNKQKEIGKPLTATEFVLYAEDEIEWTPRFSTNIGVHASMLNVEGKRYFSAQPRLSSRFALSPQWSLKGSYAQMSQYVHLLQNSFISLPTDMWVPVTAKIRPMESSQYALGLYYDNHTWEASIEGYYKDLRHLIAYKDGAAMFLTEKDWQERVAIGNGRAYGAEVLLKKSSGRTTGWIAYTLSWSDRIFPDGDVNLGRRFMDKYDNRHKLNIVVMQDLGKNTTVSATWTYSSGNRMTLETEDYFDINGNETPFYHERNNYQMPAYHRLDLSLTIKRPKKKGRMGIWNIGVYNAYNQHNSFIITTEETTQVEKNSGKAISHNKLRSLMVFPVIPSVSYTYKF